MKRSMVLVGTLLAAQTACLGSPSLVRERPGDYLEANSPGMVWATLFDGERMVITGPRIIADTIFGWAEGEEIILPVEDVKEVKVRKISIFRSSLMPAAAVGLGVAAIILTTQPKGDADPDRSQECEETGGICPDDPSMMAP